MKYLLLLIFPLLFGSYSKAQIKSAYEIKAYSLTVQFLRELGVNEATLQKSNQKGDLEKLIVAGNLLEKLNTEKGLMLMLEYEREMKEAEKLKTAVDFQRDKQKKAEAEQILQNEIAKQKERQKQEDIKKLEQEKNKRYENSDFVAVRSKIEEEFKEWYQKGEFEKSMDYKARINSISAQAFDSICYKILLQTFKQKSGFSSHLLKYNADTEKFSIEFIFNDLNFNDSVSIPIDKASKFKKDFENFEIHVDDKDWVFINNYLLPVKIYLNNRSTNQNYEFNFLHIDSKRLIFSSSEFGSSFPPINATFDFEAFQKKQTFVQTGGDIIKVELPVDYDKIFDKVEIEAKFPGGDATWRQYLDRNCNAKIATNNGAPEGTYTVIIQFVVDKVGAISDMKSLTNNGYGMEEEATRLIKKGPNWIPAVQNGRQVKSYRKVPITFYAISE